MNDPWSLKIRISIIFSSIFGFLLGRAVLEDKNPFRGGYRKTMVTDFIGDYIPTVKCKP